MVNATALQLSPACQADYNNVYNDPAVLRAYFPIPSDASTLAEAAEPTCSGSSNRCEGSSWYCCAVDISWLFHSKDVHAVAAALQENGHGHICWLKLNITRDYGNWSTLVESFDHAAPVLWPTHCTTDADRTAILALGEQGCKAHASSIHECKAVFSSPKCAGIPGGACEDWRSLAYSWQYCDAPTAHTSWAVDLTKVLGPDCRHASGVPGCCFVPLGYAGGPSFGSDCAHVCASYGRVGASVAYCEASDKGHYGNCFCGDAGGGEAL